MSGQPLAQSIRFRLGEDVGQGGVVLDIFGNANRSTCESGSTTSGSPVSSNTTSPGKPRATSNRVASSASVPRLTSGKSSIKSLARTTRTLPTGSRSTGGVQ